MSKKISLIDSAGFKNVLGTFYRAFNIVHCSQFTHYESKSQKNFQQLFYIIFDIIYF